MTRTHSFYLVSAFLAGCALLPLCASADSSHARIVRLSLIQGDVSYSRQFHKDSLNDGKAIWEPAPLNLPIREGFALSTADGARAEVEFENGAMAFLSGGTVVEFYDLSLDDGALITRLILRQGSAIFYVNPAKLDFFSVTGGDFSVEASTRTRFRLDNYDDGSAVSIEQGHVSLLRKNETKHLEKGQSYSINVDDPQNPVIARAPNYDDFDKWVSGRIDSVVTATTYSDQYVNSPSYSSGFADLYNYGGWYNVSGYGYCWQPFGMGFGWSPFAFGNWNYDPFLGWNFIGSAPWGWLPYHYGGWVFSPGLGWVWAPTGFGVRGPGIYRPVTGVWVRSNGVTGLVPMHPGDVHGRTPLNLNQGVYAVQRNVVSETTVPAGGEKWSVVNRPSRELLFASIAAPAQAPVKVSRTILSSNSGSRAVTLSRDSSIVYDGTQHRFVNSSDPARALTEAENTRATNASADAARESVTPPSNSGCNSEPCVARTITARSSASRPNVTPPSPPPSHSSHASGGTVWGGSTSSAASSSSIGSTHSSSSGGGGSHSSGGGHH